METEELVIIANASGIHLAQADKMNEGHYEIRRRSFRGDWVNTGRRFTPELVAWVKERIAKETGFVTWETWKKIFREMKKATGQDGL